MSDHSLFSSGKGKIVAGQRGRMDQPRSDSDFYRSPPTAIGQLVAALQRPLGHRIVDAGVGDGRLMLPLLELGHDVMGYDLADRGCPARDRVVLKDWLTVTASELCMVDDIVMNPPFRGADAFIEHAMDAGWQQPRIHALLRLNWIAAARRGWARRYLEQITIIGRAKMLPPGAVDKGHGGAVDFAWFTFAFDGAGGRPLVAHVQDQWHQPAPATARSSRAGQSGCPPLENTL